MPSDAADRASRGVDPWTAAFIFSAMAGLVLAAVNWEGLYAAKVWTVGAMLVSLVGHEWRRAHHPITAVGMISMGGLLIFFLRPISIPALGVTSPGAERNNRVFAGNAEAAAAVATTQVTVFLLALGIVFFLWMSRSPRTSPEGEAEEHSGDQQIRRAGILLAGALLIGLACAVLLIQSSGGFAAHFTGVANRSAFLAGRVFLTLGYVPLAVALALYVTVRRRNPDVATWTPFGYLCAATLLGIAFATGGRGPLILGALIPLMLLKQLGPRPLRTPVLIASGLAVVVGAMVMSIFLRENVYSSGEALRELQEHPVETLTSRLTSGAETRPFDSLILLNEVDDQGRLPRQHGSTYAAVPTWFIPSSLLPSKDGGANTWFTKNYLPEFYYPFRVETSVSAIGEGYANFGWLGIPLIGALTGLAAARFTRLKGRTTLRNDVFVVMLTPVFFSFVRGDAYQNLSLVILIVVLVISSEFLARPPAPKAAQTQPIGARTSHSAMIARTVNTVPITKPHSAP